MPFSSGRSVRAPASKATSTVVDRVGSSTRYRGRPFGREDETMRDMGLSVLKLASVPLCRGTCGPGEPSLVRSTSLYGRHRTPPPPPSPPRGRPPQLRAAPVGDRRGDLLQRGRE